MQRAPKSLTSAPDAVLTSRACSLPRGLHRLVQRKHYRPASGCLAEALLSNTSKNNPPALLLSSLRHANLPLGSRSPPCP